MADEKKQDKSLIPNASQQKARIYSGAQRRLIRCTWVTTLVP